ncbi:MAG: MATE family efflux transporter, partial [Shewanella sp.]
FNNLGKAKYSTLFNVGKATLGTVPFVYVGAQLGGVYGVLIGQVIGSILFGVVGVWVAYRLVDKVALTSTGHGVVSLATDADELMTNEVAQNLPSATSPLSSSCAQMAQLTEDQEMEPVLPLIGQQDNSRR